MRELIENIEKVRVNMQLNSNQALFLLAIKEGIYSVDLPAVDLLDLSKKGYMKHNRITSIALANLDLSSTKEEPKEKINFSNSKFPIINRDTGAIVKKLAKTFFKGFTKDRERVMRYCTSNALAAPYLYMFLEMFPTADKLKNQKWNKHFSGENASGVTLRRLTPGTARKFHQIWKKQDIGLFLLGTYIFIKQSRNDNDGKYYISKIESYLSEYQHWYDTAEDMLKDGTLDDWMTHRHAINNSNTTTI